MLWYNSRMSKSQNKVDDTATSNQGVEIAKKNDVAVTDSKATSFSALSDKVHEEKKRTTGLKLFDFLLYPVFTNIGVFGVSVAATYLTTRGGDRNAAGQLIYGKTGQFFQKRGEWLVNKFKSAGMTHSQADMGKMVFFSFLDGSLLAPFVKMFEDRREKIAKSIDDSLGTTPEDLSVYKAEPKQTWLSVLGGRFATAAIVVPTAVALDKTGLNERLFNKPGEQMGEWLAKKPGVKKFFGNLDVKELSRIAFFEAFYTSVCTAGLYFSSRFIAKRGENKKNDKLAAQEHSVEPAVATAVDVPVHEEEKPAVSFREQVKSKSSPAKSLPIEERARPSTMRKTYETHRDKYLDELSHSNALVSA